MGADLLVSGRLVWPGLAPAGDLLFFASPKKRRQKKGEPKSGPLRGSLRCSRRGGNSQTCPLRGLQTCEFLIPTPLRCSARPHGKAGSGSDSPSRRCDFTPSPLWGEGWGEGPRQPGCRRRCTRSRLRRPALASSAGPGGSGLRMSEGRAADKFAQTPPGPSNAVCPKQSVGTAHPARLSLGYLSLAKQRKVTRPPGRDPAKPTSRRSTR